MVGIALFGLCTRVLAEAKTSASSYQRRLLSPHWTASFERPKDLDIYSLGNRPSVIQPDAQITNRATHLRVPQQKLRGTLGEGAAS